MTILTLEDQARTRATARRAASWLRGNWLDLSLSLPALLAASWQLFLLVRLWAGRFRYPWDIEWLEGTSLYQAYRVMKGLPTYGPLRGGYLAQNHPPLYPATLALLGRVFGLDYAMARTFSLACFAGAAALVTGALLRRFGRRTLGLILSALAVGCSAAATPVCLGFFDLVRDDTMALFLCAVCAALASGRREISTARSLAMALVFTAIVYTRLPAVFLATWTFAFVLVRHPASGLRVTILATAFCGIVLVGLLFMSHGWYWLLTIALVQDQRIRPERLLEGIRIVLAFAPFLPFVPLLALGLAVARKISAASILWSGMLLASFPASLLPWSKVGGFENDFVPLLFFVGPATAFVVGDLVLALRSLPRVSRALEGAVVLAGVSFLALRTWDSARFTPTEGMHKAATRLNERVASLPGGAVAPRHPFLPIRNGHTTLGWSDMPYLDMLWSDYRDLDLGSYIDRSHARYALVYGGELWSTARELSIRYQLDDTVVDGPPTVIGDPSTIRYVLRANDDERGGHVVFDFESLSGWSGTPGAFVITDPFPDWQHPLAANVGRHLVDSYTRQGGDRVTGTIVSPPFVVDRQHMSLRVGGGTRASNRVELRVDGLAQRQATSIWREQETLTRVVWDVSPYVGKTAQIALVDDDVGSWGHLTCDHVVLY